MYDVEHSHVKQENFRETEQEEEQRIFEEVNTEEGKVLLFTTKTCPNCKLAKDSLEKANISYEVVDAGENEELVKKIWRHAGADTDRDQRRRCTETCKCVQYPGICRKTIEK